jgi:hypothetical protein
MGVTVHYRGTLADIGRIEDFEDRVIDFALAVGGNPRIWRSADDADPKRMVRGLLIDLAPGQETTSLLVSPEGWFITPLEIEAAEKAQVTEPSWCFVKTQFGPIEGHVALIELLAGIKKEFAPDLEVLDEGDYWERRDLGQLKGKLDFLNMAINAMADALEGDRLSPEAREDPEILATRIESLARKVQATIGRPSEHPPIQFPDESSGVPPTAAENESLWDELFANNRRKQERMTRVIEEQTIRGENVRDAFDAAIDEVVPPNDWDDEAGDNEVAELIEELNAASQAALEEPWQGSSSGGMDDDIADAGDDADEPFERMERHPLQQRATALMFEFYDVAKRGEERSQSIDMLIRNAMEITGGLAQALPLGPTYEMDGGDAGLGLVQLKRALRGAAFVRGALFLVKSDGAIDGEEFHRFMDEANAISEEIVEMLRSIRERQG